MYNSIIDLVLFLLSLLLLSYDMRFLWEFYHFQYNCAETATADSLDINNKNVQWYIDNKTVVVGIIIWLLLLFHNGIKIVFCFSNIKCFYI